MERQTSVLELPKEQIQALNDRLEQELEHLTASLRTLNLAVSRLQRSLHSLESFSSRQENSHIMVPLTSSLYVKGQVKNPNHVLVDIGTGYYVKQTCDKAENYVQRRISQVKKEIEKIQQFVLTKQEQYEYVSGALRQRT
eukprot:jgi/Galph1/966/GphlegSOOS_G5698.1